MHKAGYTGAIFNSKGLKGETYEGIVWRDQVVQIIGTRVCLIQMKCQALVNVDICSCALHTILTRLGGWELGWL